MSRLEGVAPGQPHGSSEASPVQGRRCPTPTASGGGCGPAAGRALTAAGSAAVDRVTHDWGPWSPLSYTGTLESLEHRFCACGQEQITASDCLGWRPRRATAVSCRAAVAS